MHSVGAPLKLLGAPKKRMRFWVGPPKLRSSSRLWRIELIARQSARTPAPVTIPTWKVSPPTARSIRRIGQLGASSSTLIAPLPTRCPTVKKCPCVFVDADYLFPSLQADVAELADAPDSKSGSRKGVWVRPPPSAIPRGDRSRIGTVGQMLLRSAMRLAGSS